MTSAPPKHFVLDEDASPPSRSAPSGPGLCLVIGLLLFLALEALVFRSGVYEDLTDPDSYHGQYVELLRFHGSGRPSEARRDEVLLLGDSRMGEGVSAALADEVLAPLGLRLVHAGLAGSTPRVWERLVRELDPDGDRFAAVLLPVICYDDVGIQAGMAGRDLDLRFIGSRLRLTEAWGLAQSFGETHGGHVARRAAVLPGSTLRDDVVHFLRHPSRRLRRVRASVTAGLEARRAYPGRDADVRDLLARWEVEPEDPSLPADLRAHLNRELPPPDPAQHAYLEAWLAPIARRAAEGGARVIVMRPPRAPLPLSWAAAEAPDSVVRRLEREGVVTLLPEDLFRDLERPELFFDAVHLNAAGRERFTRELFQRVARELAP